MRGGIGGGHWWGVMGGHSGGEGLGVKLTMSSSLLYLATIKDKLPSEKIRHFSLPPSSLPSLTRQKQDDGHGVTDGNQWIWTSLILR